MHYVLDTGFFVDARKYYLSVFPSFWLKLNEAANENIISSADEVREEVKNYGSAQKRLLAEQEHLLAWISNNKRIFGAPGESEQEKLRQIVRRFPEALEKSKNAHGGKWADPFVIARAWDLKATVVTGERSAKDKTGHVPSFIKIPDICDKLDVRCVNPEEFMRELGWSF